MAIGVYPERKSRSVDYNYGPLALPAALLPDFFCLRARDSERMLSGVARLGAQLDGRPQSELVQYQHDLVRSLRAAGTTPENKIKAFALIRELAIRTLQLRHYDCQLLAGWAILNGKVAEMATGEGKTLAISLAAATAAMAGTPVHVLTANDYLAARDAETLIPLYKSLGLSVGVVTSDLSHKQRQSAYACDITYCTAKELAFDYLRDRLLFGSDTNEITRRVDCLYGQGGRSVHLLLRGLHYAILDECDNILVDEARTPLILSKPGESDSDDSTYPEVLKFARSLQAGEDFEIHQKSRNIELTTQCEARLADLPVSVTGGFEALLRSALSALHLFNCDEHYLVRDGGIQIIDGNTGRLRPGHKWEGGLHQMIELKEGCQVSPDHQVLCRISFQKLFSRYLRLAGASGTAVEVRAELRTVYGLDVMRVPTHRTVRRQLLPESVFVTAEEKLSAIVAQVFELSKSGRPLLIGARSVFAAEELSQRLTAVGLAHQLLSARQDQNEAEVVARAGEAGRITVATNMAGRGTDIPLGADVPRLGGLHVIATERHEAARLDRQLFGRCGRQGDPGSCELFTCLEDDLVNVYCPGWLTGLAIQILRPASGSRCGIGIVKLIGKIAQRRAERHHAQLRRELLAMDDRLNDSLGFTGPGE